MPAYNPKVIQTYANQLYAKAALVIAFFVIVGAVLLTAVAFVLLFFTGSFIGPELVFPAIAGALLGLGYGLQRSQEIRLHAQLALCLLAIEENTRRR